MPNVKRTHTPKSVMPKVRTVLKNATRRERGKNVFMTAYQILAALPEATRKRLIKKYGLGGKDSGHTPAATQIVSEAAEMVPDIEIMYFDTRFTTFVVDDGKTKIDAIPSAPYCALFRLPDGSPTARRCNLSPGIASASLKTTGSRTRGSRRPANQ